MKLLRFLSAEFIVLQRLSSKGKKMDNIRQLQNFPWCKPDWCFPSMVKENTELLRQCCKLPPLELSDNVEDIIHRSRQFPIEFPVQTVRLEKLKDHRPVETLKKNIVSTYPIIHERVLLLMTHFLIYKREFGTSIEKALYKDMSIPQFIDRILQKRAVSFMGSSDKYKLLSGEQGQEGWEAVGTLNQKPPLLLENCLSYDEMKISALVYVSGPTVCINNGSRTNSGIVDEEGVEKDAVIIGIIGPRFERENRMEYEDVLVTEHQNTPENGYGEEVTPTTCLNVLKTTYVRNPLSARHMWRQMWAEFYQAHSYTHAELAPYVTSHDRESLAARYVALPAATFDNELYHKRLAVTNDCVLLEAAERGRDAGRFAFVNVIGAGLGVWRISAHQRDVYILSFIERIRALLKKGLLDHVSDVNFAYIEPSATVLGLFKNQTNPGGEESPKRLFMENKTHPRGGVAVYVQRREPSAQLSGEHAGKLLVLTYPWDGNAHPGNEFWLGSLSGSGDPAAACSTQVAELHNAHINPAVQGLNTRVAGRQGIRRLAEYCDMHLQ